MGPRGDTSAGEKTYATACKTCHGASLEGSPFGPTLTGQAFISKWRGRFPELLAQMRTTMPPKGSVPVDQAAYPDLMAFLLSANFRGAPTETASTPTTGTTTGPGSAAAKRLLSQLTPVTAEMLAAPPDGDWLLSRRTLDAAGFSPLQQINRGSVRQLRQAWRLRLAPSSNEITPLVHDGVLYVYSGTVLQAVDATNGTPLWRYERGGGGGSFPGGGGGSPMKSIAIYGNALFIPTPNGRLLALDARTGKQLWDRSFLGQGRGGYQISSGPLVARGVVMVSVSLGLSTAGGCFIVGIDAATGEERWRFHTIARPGSPDGDSWNGAPLEERFGGGVWTTGSYDPTLNLAYFGVGNTYTTATLLSVRAGLSSVTNNDGLYTNATLALRPETGELVWHHQHHRRDVWDQDWAFEQTLVTLGSGANARRAVVTGGKTGIFEAVDAATGKFLFAHDTGITNLFLGIDAATGAKRPNPALEPAPGKTLLLCPSNLGSRNWPATALNPATRTLFIPMLESCADFTWNPRGPEELAYGGSDMQFSSRLRPDSDGNLGRMLALDLTTQRVLWTHRQPMPLSSSLLATAGGLVFMADLERHFSAYDEATGERLWRTTLPAAAESTPITYAVNGKQYIAVVSGEGSHLGTSNRRLVPTLGAPNTEISLVVFALR
jgi:alcohol dehydrogenase (cytochrome c)